MKKPDLVLTGGKVMTCDPAKPLAEAVAVADGGVAAVGSAKEIAKLGRAAETVKLTGRAVIPGLTDSHMHLQFTGWALADVNLYGVSSIRELVERMRSGARSRPEGLLAGRSDCLHAKHLAEGRLPTCEDLDRVAADRPVAVTDVNKTIVNSLVLRGIDAENPSVADGQSYYRDGAPRALKGGEIGRFPNGKPNGVFLYAAKALTPLGGQSAASASKMSPEDAIIAAQDAMLARGLTCAVDANVGPEDFAALVRLHRDGRLRIRVRAYLRSTRFGSMEAILRAMDEFGPGDDLLRVGGVKLFYDPFLMHRTALFYEPYRTGEAANCGTRTISQEELTRWLRDCAKRGIPTGTHTTGTKGLDEVIEAHERVEAEVALARPSHLIHAYFPGDRAVERIKALGLSVALQPSFIRPWAETAVEFLGEARARGFTPCRTYLDAGIITGGGTDSPITHFDPFASIASAASRLSAAGRVLGPEERISNAEALALYTTGSAAITGEARTRGVLRPGALADAVVCSADPLSVEPDSMRDVRALITVVGGKVVHRAEGA